MSLASIIIPIEKEDVENLKNLGTTYEVYRSNVARIIEDGGAANPNAFSDYQEEERKALIAFNDAKEAASKKYIPSYLYNQYKYNWNIDYASETMTLITDSIQAISIIKMHTSELQAEITE